MPERRLRHVPIAIWLPAYDRSWLRGDLLAAVAVWAVLVPQAVGYAAIAGAPPQAGLFAALGAGLLYAIFGTCRELDVGPSSTIAVTAAAVLIPVAAEHPGDDYVVLLAALAMLTGVALIAAGALRLGFVAEFLARPVLVGFISGIGVVIAVGQIPNLLGITITSGNVLESLWRIVGAIGSGGWRTPVIGLVSLAALLGLRALNPKLPWALLVAMASIAVSRAFDLQAKGVAVIAEVPAGLPTPAIPHVGVATLTSLGGGAMAIALVALAESVGAARSLAARNGYEVDANKELVALGAANVGAGVLQGFPVDASLSRSAVAVGAGRRSQLSGLVVAVLVVVTMLFLTPLFDGLPKATLAAIIIAAVIGLVDVAGFRKLWRLDRDDARLALIAFAAVCFFGVLVGIVIAVVASLLALVQRVYRPSVAVLGRVASETSPDEDFSFRDVERHPEYVTFPGLVIFRFSGELFFANASYFRDEILRVVDAAGPTVRAVLVDASAISHVDTTASAMLDDLIDRLGTRDVGFELARATASVREILRRNGLEERLGSGTVHDTVRAAVASFVLRSGGTDA